MKQAATIELFSYWDALRAGLDRALLDATSPQTRALLASTFLVEVDDRRAFPLRVTGSILTRLTSNARLGASFLECWDAESRGLIEAMLGVVHEERLPVVIGARARGGEQTMISVECLLLPLATDPARKPRILGGMATTGAVNRRASPAPLEVVSARAIRKFSTQYPSFGTENSLLSTPPHGSAFRERFSHLRVIDGGRT